MVLPCTPISHERWKKSRVMWTPYKSNGLRANIVIIKRMAVATVNILLTLRAFHLAVNTGINNVVGYLLLLSLLLIMVLIPWRFFSFTSVNLIWLNPKVKYIQILSRHSTKLNNWLIEAYAVSAICRPFNSDNSAEFDVLLITYDCIGVWIPLHIV
mgnify:CR=1 FL=1